MYSRKFQTHINNNDMMNNNCNNTVVANNKNAMLNPLVDYENNNNNFSGMTHTENGLRAASHVSMEHTAQAHEFQPTCKCADCQSLIKHYTNYEILDAYVTHHLAYESSLQANFGFVPCIGGPFGHVAMKTVIDQDGNENQQPVPSNTYVFHMHLHHMNPVPTDVKERSLARFLAPKETIGTSAMMIPTPNSKRVNNNHNHGRMMNTNTHNKAVAASPSYNNNNNYYGHHQQSFNQHPHFNNYNNLPAYTRDDVEQAAYVSNFTGGAARLGN